MKNEYNLIDFDIIEKDIKSFYDFITEFPLLGLDHRVGLEIRKEIQIVQKSIINCEIWYRGKAPEGYKVFENKDMMPPLPEDTREGRYNHYGMPALYVSENEETCAEEICREKSDKILCWIQRIKIQNAKIIDFTQTIAKSSYEKFPYILCGLIMTEAITTHNFQNRKYYKPEYKITRFIADLCRMEKIDGIIYPSSVSFNQNKPYRNLVLFDLTGEKFKFENDPYIFEKK